MEQRIPHDSMAYIASSWARTLTICGPPHVLHELCKSGGLRATVPLPLYAPYHAPHIYDIADINMLVGEFTKLQANDDFNRFELAGARTCEGELDSTVPPGLKHALAEALKAILLDRVDFQKIVGDLKYRLRSYGVTEALLIPVASSAATTILQALNLGTQSNSRDGIAKIQLDHPILQPYTDAHIRGSAGQYTSRSKIAIVGMSCRLPHANGTEEFWELLSQGMDVHETVPPSRWNSSTHVDVSDKPRKNTSATPYGCWLEQPGHFDGRFFGMSPRECEQVDPAQRLALMTAYEALEDGGIVPGAWSTQRDRVGVWYVHILSMWM